MLGLWASYRRKQTPRSCIMKEVVDKGASNMATLDMEKVEINGTEGLEENGDSPTNGLKKNVSFSRRDSGESDNDGITIKFYQSQDSMGSDSQFEDENESELTDSFDINSPINSEKMTRRKPRLYR